MYFGHDVVKQFDTTVCVCEFLHGVLMLTEADNLRSGNKVVQHRS